MSVASAYWVEGFSRVWREGDLADEDAAVRAWYRDLLAPHVPARVRWTLDLGCGSGRTVSVLAQLCPSASHVAIDGSEEAVRRTALRMEAEAIPGVARCIDITAPGFAALLPPEHRRFDLITCFFVIHHYPREMIARVLAECRELCDHNGVIVLAECHDPTDARARATEHTLADLAQLAGQPPDLLLAPDVLERACAEAGFSRDEVRFEVRNGHPFTDGERARHTARLARLQGRVRALRQHLGPSQPSELVQLESLVERMSAWNICGPIRHAPVLAVLRRKERPPAGRQS